MALSRWSSRVFLALQRNLAPTRCTLHSSTQFHARDFYTNTYSRPYALGAYGSCSSVRILRWCSSLHARPNVVALSSAANLVKFNSSQKRWQSTETVDEKEAKKSANKSIMYSFYATLAMILGGCGWFVLAYGGPQHDKDGNVILDDYSSQPVVLQYIMRSYREVLLFKKAVEEPSREKLLPDPLKEPYIQPPYTLSLEITDVLVHPEWSLTTGWRFKKRPGLEFFLEQLGPYFEVITYTKETGIVGFSLIDQLDTQGRIWYRLFRDATRYIDGVFVKDLGALNRPVKRVIHVDWDEKAVQLHRNNAVRIKKWDGSMEDRTLVDLAIFLRTIAESGVDDVRGVLEYYSQFEDPLAAFRENQRKVAEQEMLAKEAEKAKPVPAWSAFKARR